MEGVKVWEERVVIPTYEIGKPEKNPMFLDKRVYQGSCGKVYPYPTVESISDEKKDKEYQAVYLENEYLKIMILPELGGRIQRAYDKTNDYDFVYYNHVIKPALVGLTGPWISGGIEFNWPQHHRPTTFLPVDHLIKENEDGSCSVLVNDVDQMYGTKGIAKFTLYPGKAYIEITGQLYNRTSLPQTFLWWANPAVAVNENTQSIFPPDVHAVMDHGKRDVSRFPIATGVYYKKDYSEGVDISRYKNIPVPTSYMAEKSKYDFVGGYDYGKEAGLLHVADHHVSPGKKQWTWGCGDFGKAWDRNLTDEDGPYIELMTGVFTDNQPDFTWLKPFEEKTFTQYFMPYKKVGQVKNANTEVVFNLSFEEKDIRICVYGTEHRDVTLTLDYQKKTIYQEEIHISPEDVFEKKLSLETLASGTNVAQTEFTLSVWEGKRKLLSYTPEQDEIQELPKPAQAIGTPESIATVEELYLAGLHIEQYRHATYLPDPYYLEGLKRDPLDIRCNDAYGTLLMRRGNYEDALTYFQNGLKRLTSHNTNPYTSEIHYHMGLLYFYEKKYEDAYDSFFKATWSNEQQEMSFYYLAAIDSICGRYAHGLQMVERGLIKNSHNVKARGLKAYLLRKCGKENQNWLQENLQVDAFDYVSRFEVGNEEEFLRVSRGFVENNLMTARDYGEFGAYEEALEVLALDHSGSPIVAYYQAYYNHLLGEEKTAEAFIHQAEQADSTCCFPNKLEDMEVLQFAVEQYQAPMAAYYLGNLFYDKLRWKESLKLWEFTSQHCTSFPTVFRNLSLVYFNKCHEPEKAQTAMEKAFLLDESDVRIFLELDQLYKKRNMPIHERLRRMEARMELVEQRDDLYIEYLTLLNMDGQHEKAYENMMHRHFHPWEGGEGKVTTQYTNSLLAMARKEIRKGNGEAAEGLLRKALVYPENLGEGKLEGTKDNHIYYHLGLALELQGKEAEARQCFELATLGTDEPAGMMYYNDQPADMILYQGLAFRKLGETGKANGRCYRLIDYGEQHLHDEVKIGYFAVSLPDFLIFDEDYSLRNQAHCNYLMGLGYLGLGKEEKAEEFFFMAQKLQPEMEFRR